jgi:hypothetical protein
MEQREAKLEGIDPFPPNPRERSFNGFNKETVAGIVRPPPFLLTGPGSLFREEE